MKIQNFIKCTEIPKINAIADFPLPTEHLCELHEFTNEIPTIIDIIRKIKMNLKLPNSEKLQKN